MKIRIVQCRALTQAFPNRVWEREIQNDGASVGWVEQQRNPPLSLTIQNDGVRSHLHFATIIKIGFFCV